MSEQDGQAAVPEEELELAAAHEPEGDEAAAADTADTAAGAEPQAAVAEELPAEAPGEAIDLATALAQRDDYLAHARRLQADFENFRKRTLKQQSDQAHAATARLVEQLLPVLDACDSAVIHGVEGVAPIHKQLLDTLTKAGLEVVATEGAPFDPTIHEAVLHEPRDADDDGGEPEITEVLRTGYLWHGRTLRAAMVKVRD